MNLRTALFAIVATSLLSSEILRADVAYTITDLDLTGASYVYFYSINSSGEVVSRSGIRNRDYATLFSGTGTDNIDLGTLGGPHSSASDINDGGQIVGWANVNSEGASHAVLFGRNGAPNKDLGTLGGGGSFAADINNVGQIVGDASIVAPYDIIHATLFSGTGAGNIDLGGLGGQTSGASAINDAGQIVGWARNFEDKARAVLFKSTGNIDLGTLGGEESWTSDINASGQIIGDAQLPGDYFMQATLFSGTGTDNTFLGSLGGRQSKAFAINDAGQIVGGAELPDSNDSHAFIYENGQMTDLNDLIDPESGWVLTSAFAINNSGQIVARGYGKNGHPLLLTPIPVAPEIAIEGRKAIQTKKPIHLIKGRAKGAFTSVTCRVGAQGRETAVRGKSHWRFRAHLKVGRNVIIATAHGPGGDSSLAKVTVIRRKK